MDNPAPPSVNTTSFPPTNNVNPVLPNIDEGGVPIIPTEPSEIISKPPFKGGMGWKRTVATVFGLLLLVGGIGAGVILVKNNQDIRNRAATCNPVPAGCTCSGSGDGNVCKGDWFNASCTGGCTITCQGTKNCPDENTPKPSGTPAGPACHKKPNGNDNCCPGDEACQEDSSGNNTGYNCTCVRAGGVYDWRCTDYNTDKCASSGPPPAPSYKCDAGVTNVNISGNCLVVISGGAVYMARYSCLEGTNMTGGCSDNAENFTTTKLCADSPSSNWCGTVQVDYGQHPNGCSVSRKFPCSSSSPTSHPSSSPTPSPTPPICLNVKAYNSAWVELSTAELTNLKPGDEIYFAVTAANGNTGSIDKAKFTINGTVGSEVTDKHGSSFYVDFTVPAGILNFSVSAQLHSTVFGWF